MKFLGSLFTFAVLGISAVFSAPAINQYDDTFHYWISDTNMKATIMGVVNKNVKEVVVKPWVTVEGRRYYVYQFGAAAFSGTKVQTIIINNKDANAKDQFVESINISPNALRGATNLRKIVFNTEKVTADLYAFDGCNKDINFVGKGVPNLVNNYAKKLLSNWGFPVNKDYTNLSDATIRKALYDLAKKVKNTFTVNERMTYGNNVAVALGLQAGDSNGIARAYRILARNMGFRYNDVHVGGDNGITYWNYVYINKGNGKKWYHLDLIDNSVPSSYSSNIFKTDEQQKAVKVARHGKYSYYSNPENWVIYINEYNYQGEVEGGSKTENFTNWLIRNRQGVRA